MNFNIDPMANIRESLNAVQEEHERKRKYEEEVLNTLKEIENNTANLTEIIGLIRNSGKYQEEIYSLVTEILEVVKSKNKEEAEGKYRKVMKKVAAFTGDVETMQKLTGFGNTVMTVVSQFNA